jgi:glycosyltransferase involved in cell wall biosynthesis
VPDLSIVAVIPLYNGARWIEQSLASVIAQTLPPDEIVVVDDGSTDDGPSIVQQYSVALLRKPNGGQSSARNFGIGHSSSNLIALLDQDDIWYPAHLERLVKPFRCPSRHMLGWTYSNLDFVFPDGRIIHNFLSGLPFEQPKRTLKRCLGEDMHILPSASLISRAAFEDVGRFDERLQGYEDDDLFLRIFMAGYKNEYIDEALSQWRQISNSSGNSPRMLTSALIFMDKILQWYPEASAVIADRFGRNFMTFYERAVKARDWDYCYAAIQAIKRVGAIEGPSIIDYKTGIINIVT